MKQLSRAIKHSPPLRRLTLGAGLLIALSGCQAGVAQVMPAPAVQPSVHAAAGQGSTPAQAAAQSQAFTAKLQVSPAHAQVGQTVQVQGSGYPASTDVDMVWHSAQGRYELEGGTEFVGQRYTETSRVLTTVRATSEGDIDAKVQVPEDFGGGHDLRGRVQGQEISQTNVTVDPTFSMNPSEGPLGTAIELRIVGVDSSINSNTWHVLYDNRYLGFMSAVTTHGVAVARIRAAGPVGVRSISVWHNSFNSTPYLNWPQGPYKDTPVASFTFNVTSDPGPAKAIVEDFAARDNPWPVQSDGSGQLSVAPDRGTAGTATILKASHLPANATLSLSWATMVGNRVSSTGFTEESRALGEVTTGPDGAFNKPFSIPNDLGGQHRIDVKSGDKVLASASLVIEPSVVSVDPVTVHAGDTINLHFRGFGWTTYDNTYAVTYDNSYIGYACGFSTAGDVEFKITATGAPGTHLIDLYPTIYKGKDAMPRVYSVPQLTYADDHPQRITPAIRLAVEIAN